MRFSFNILSLTLASIFIYHNFTEGEIVLVGLLYYFLPFIIISSIIIGFWCLIQKNTNWFIIILLLSILNIPILNKFWFQRTSFYTTDKKESFNILSYNLSFLKINEVFSEKYYQATENDTFLELNEFLLDKNTEILCFQEFFTDKKFMQYNIDQKLKTQDYQGVFYSKPFHDNGIVRGLAIYSKFELINHDTIFFSENRFNGAMYADIIVNNDTLRVVNVHLESNQLNPPDDGLLAGSIYFWKQMKEKKEVRNKQYAILNDFLAKQTLPILLTGDFNSIPFAKKLRNLEKLGFNICSDKPIAISQTLNSKQNLPIVIDYQLYNKNILPIDYSTIYNIRSSDHFPTLGKYIIKKSK